MTAATKYNLAALREQAERAEPNTCPCDELLALLDAVEAAQTHVRAMAECPRCDGIEHADDLLAALRHFDFGGADG